MDEKTPTTRNRLFLAVGALLLAGLFSLLFGLLCDLVFGHEIWTAFVLDNFSLIVGLPMAAGLAFGVVIAFQQTTEGPLSMRFGPLELSGPTGPILLWVVCYLASVLAITLVT